MKAPPLPLPVPLPITLRTFLCPSISICSPSSSSTLTSFSSLRHSSRSISTLLTPRSLPTPLHPSSPSPLLRSLHSTPSLSFPPSKSPTPSSDLYDEQIPFSSIRLVDPSTSSLLPPGNLKDLLSQLDRSRFKILLVDGKQEIPVCRIVDVKMEYEKAREKKEKLKERKLSSSGASTSGLGMKELQITWGVSLNDLQHKLLKGKELLGKGYGVKIVLSSKKGQKSNEEERKRVEELVRASLEGEGGGGKYGKKNVTGGGGEKVEIEFKPV